MSHAIHVVVAMEGEEHAVDVAAFDTVGDLVDRVRAELAPPDRFQLAWRGAALRDMHETLGDLRIADGDQLVLEVPEVVLAVRVDGQVGQWTVPDTSTVGELKARIRADAVLPEDFDLLWTRGGALTHDAAVLHELGFSRTEELDVVLPRVQLRVSIEGIGDILVQVRTYDTLRRLKQTVRLEQPFLGERFGLAVYNSAVLLDDDDATMTELGIHHNDRLRVVIPFAVIARNQLLERGREVSGEGLVQCALAADWDDVRLMLATEDVDGAAALMLCAARGLTHEVRGLLECGVAPRATEHGTPLLHATFGGHRHTAMALLKAGVDVDEASNGMTPLEAAIEARADRLVFTFLTHGASTRFPSGHTALTAAAEFNNVDAIEALLARGIPPDTRSDQGRTALSVAAREGFAEAVDVLIRGRADVNAADARGHATPLMAAASHGHTDVVAILTRSGASIDSQDVHGRTALARAAQNGHMGCVEALLCCGASVDLASDLGATPLLCAAHNGHIDVAAVLIAGGADVHHRSKDGSTALGCARHGGHEALVEMLIADGAEEGGNGERAPAVVAHDSYDARWGEPRSGGLGVDATAVSTPRTGDALQAPPSPGTPGTPAEEGDAGVGSGFVTTPRMSPPTPRGREGSGGGGASSMDPDADGNDGSPPLSHRPASGNPRPHRLSNGASTSPDPRRSSLSSGARRRRSSGPAADHAVHRRGSREWVGSDPPAPSSGARATDTTGLFCPPPTHTDPNAGTQASTAPATAPSRTGAAAGVVAFTTPPASDPALHQDVSPLESSMVSETTTAGGRRMRTVKLSFMSKDKGRPEHVRDGEREGGRGRRGSRGGAHGSVDAGGGGGGAAAAAAASLSTQRKASRGEPRDVAGWVASTTPNLSGTPPVDDGLPLARGRSGSNPAAAAAAKAAAAAPEECEAPPRRPRRGMPTALILDSAGGSDGRSSPSITGRRRASHDPALWPTEGAFQRHHSVDSPTAGPLRYNLTPRGKQLSHLARRQSRPSVIALDTGTDTASALASPPLAPQSPRAGRTPLTAAAFDGKSRNVLALLKQGCGINEKDQNGLTALMAAVYNGHVAVVDELIKYGADVNLPDDDGMTPLMYAAVAGETLIAGKLILRRAKANRQMRDGRTALMRAAQYGHRSTAEVLILRGKADVDMQTRQGATAMMLAALNGHEHVMALLLHHGGNPHLEDKEGMTALGCAAYAGHAGAAQLLLNEGDANAGHTEHRHNETALMIASRRGHDRVVQAIVAHSDCMIDAVNDRGRTALMCAASHGRRACVETLLRVGAEASIRDKEGNTAFLHAAMGNDVPTFERLLHSTLDVNEANKERTTAVFYAVANNSMQMLDGILKDPNIDVNVTATRGITPLMVGAMYGHLEAVQALVAAGADVGARTTAKKTACDIAGYYEHRDCVEHLRAHGGAESVAGSAVRQDSMDTRRTEEASDTTPPGGTRQRSLKKSPPRIRPGRLSPTGSGSGGQSPTLENLPLSPTNKGVRGAGDKGGLVSPKGKRAVRRLSLSAVRTTGGVNGEKKEKDKEKDDSGELPLVVAAMNGHLQKVGLLLQRGVGVNEGGEGGRTPLQAAALNGHRDVLDLLITCNADVGKKDDLGLTALACAAQQGHVAAMEVLIAAGADANRASNDGRTPIMRAAWCRHLSAVKVLLQHDADPAMRDDEGRGAIIYAVMAGDKDVVRTLVKQECGVNHLPEDGRPALMRAVYKGYAGIVSILVAHGADPNIANSEGRTPLMYATTNNFPEIVKFFAERGANLDAQDKDGNTALIRAAATGRTEIAMHLLEGGASVDIRAKNGWVALDVAQKNGHTDIAELITDYEEKRRQEKAALVKKRSLWACCVRPQPEA